MAPYQVENTTPKTDSVSRVNFGIINVVKDVLGLSITSIWMASTVNTFHLETSIFICLVFFIIIDFYNRLTYTIVNHFNFMLNKQIITLRLKSMRLVCTLRRTISSFINLIPFILTPAAILGVSAAPIIGMLLIHSFLQLLNIVKYIKKNNFLDHVFATPKQHSVYYFINPKYIE